MQFANGNMLMDVNCRKQNSSTSSHPNTHALLRSCGKWFAGSHICHTRCENPPDAHSPPTGGTREQHRSHYLAYSSLTIGQALPYLTKAGSSTGSPAGAIRASFVTLSGKLRANSETIAPPIDLRIVKMSYPRNGEDCSVSPANKVQWFVQQVEFRQKAKQLGDEKRSGMVYILRFREPPSIVIKSQYLEPYVSDM